MLKKHRGALMEAIRHNITNYDYQTGNNTGNMKFVFKVINKNDEDNKLVGIAACEKNIPKFTTCYYKLQVKSATAISYKSKLMPTNTKALFLIKVFIYQSNMNHTICSKEMKIFAKDFSVIQA